MLVLLYHSVPRGVFCSTTVYHAVYLETLSQRQLCDKLAALYAIGPTQIVEILLQGPSGILILVTNTVGLLAPHYIYSLHLAT